MLYCHSSCPVSRDSANQSCYLCNVNVLLLSLSLSPAETIIQGTVNLKRCVVPQECPVSAAITQHNCPKLFTPHKVLLLNKLQKYNGFFFLKRGDVRSVLLLNKTVQNLHTSQLSASVHYEPNWTQITGRDQETQLILKEGWHNKCPITVHNCPKTLKTHYFIQD